MTRICYLISLLSGCAQRTVDRCCALAKGFPFLFFLISNALNAQDFHIERITAEPGLSQGTVNCITQDRQGFIWVGTEDGLNRFDGYQFKHYKNQQGNSSSLSNNIINAIVEDGEGFLWVATSNGLNRFDPSTESFRQFHPDPKNPNSIAFESIYSILEDKSGDALWLGASTTLDKFDKESGKFTHFKPPTKLPVFANDNVITTIAEFENDLYIGTWGDGVWRFQKDVKKFTRIYTDAKEAEDLRWTRRIWTDSYGELYAIINDIVFQFKLELVLFSQLPFPQYGKENLTNAFFKNSSDQLIVATSGKGLKIFSHDFQHLETLQFDADSSLVNNNNVTTIFKDRCGLFWLGARGGGLSLLDVERKKFQWVQGNASNPISSHLLDITSILETQSGEIWIANKAHGIYCFDTTTHQPIHIGQKSGIPQGMATKEVKVLFQDSQQRIWVGTWGKGLIMWDVKNGVFRNYINDRSDEHTLADNFITSIAESKDHKLWIATAFGVSVLELEKLESGFFKNYLYKKDHHKGLSHPRAEVVFCDHSGQIWVGTGDGGLNLYNQAQDTFRYFLHDPDDPKTLGSNRVISIFEDRASRLWVGTFGGGLHRYEPDKQLFIHFKEQEGLPSDIVTGIVEDSDGFLWLTTNMGLSKFDVDKNIFTNYFKQDGLLGDQFNERAICFSHRAGEIYAGGKDGVTFFHPDSIRNNAFVPPVVISSIKKYVTQGQQTRTVDIEGAGTIKYIEVPFSQNTLAFEFAALNFRQTFKNQYAYKLEGLGRSWNDLGPKREVTFSNLPSGKYNLRVKGSNNDGVWNEQGISLEIRVLPPWYRTWWAYLSYILAFGSLFYFYRKRELREQELKHQLELEHLESEKLKEVDQLKSRFFVNISHEFRTPLTLILGQLDSSMERIKDESVKSKLGMAFRNGKRLLQLINQLLDLSKLEAGSMKLHAVEKDLIPFLKNLYFSFESLAEQRKLSLVFQCTETSMPLFFDEYKLEKVFFNLLSNAIKFTPEGGKIAMIVEKADAPFFVKITIRDTGVGIPAERLPFVFNRFFQVDSSRTREREGTGIGLALVKEFVGLHSGQVSVKSQEGLGADFVVVLPFGERTDKLAEEEMPAFDLSPTDAITLADKPVKGFSKNDKEVDKAQLLIVEDNADVRSYLHEHLVEAGYQIIEAVNGENGLALAQEHLPDLILTDVMMPRMDGYAFSRHIRSDERTSHIPIIMLTAKAAEDDKIEGLEIGVDDYLTKPFSAKELHVRVANLIRQRQQLRERFSRATVIRPAEVSAISVDQVFLEKIIHAIESHISDEQFGVETLSNAVNMSVTHLNRKLNALIGQSAGHLIRSMRLQRAADLLAQNAGNVAEIAFQVGFSVPENFSRSFKKQFGCSPGEYQKKKAVRQE